MIKYGVFMQRDIELNKQRQKWCNNIKYTGMLISGAGIGVFISRYPFFASKQNTVWDGVPALALCLIGSGLISLAKNITAKVK